MEIATSIFLGTLMVLTVIYCIFTFLALSEDDDKKFWLIMSNCVGFLTMIILIFGVFYDLLNS